MLIKTLTWLFNRDLKTLKSEIESYKTESNLWVIEKGILNSAGNLCLHLVGNLNTYIGATLGQSGYIRNRELEFSLKNIPQQELVKKIEDTILVLNKTLASLTEADLSAEYPIVVFEDKMTTEFFLIHLTTHLTYHLGQINYHRRLLDL
ncbi:DinB family protein [Pedobacter nototheniae]|uniref:DinB family protein n=1 Tax=Pedobacter nototheniae TaxID=2488994 RepID=UPI002930F8D1|nr:DinB family protein [Pedobacter nototheniae]